MLCSQVQQEWLRSACEASSSPEKKESKAIKSPRQTQAAWLLTEELDEFGSVPALPDFNAACDGMPAAVEHVEGSEASEALQEPPSSALTAEADDDVRMPVEYAATFAGEATPPSALENALEQPPEVPSAPSDDQEADHAEGEDDVFQRATSALHAARNARAVARARASANEVAVVTLIDKPPAELVMEAEPPRPPAPPQPPALDPQAQDECAAPVTSTRTIDPAPVHPGGAVGGLGGMVNATLAGAGSMTMPPKPPTAPPGCSGVVLATRMRSGSSPTTADVVGSIDEAARAASFSTMRSYRRRRTGEGSSLSSVAVAAVAEAVAEAVSSATTTAAAASPHFLGANAVWLPALRAGLTPTSKSRVGVASPRPIATPPFFESDVAPVARPCFEAAIINDPTPDLSTTAGGAIASSSVDGSVPENLRLRVEIGELRERLHSAEVGLLSARSNSLPMAGRSTAGMGVSRAPVPSARNTIKKMRRGCPSNMKRILKSCFMPRLVAEPSSPGLAMNA